MKRGCVKLESTTSFKRQCKIPISIENIIEKENLYDSLSLYCTFQQIKNLRGVSISFNELILRYYKLNKLQYIQYSDNPLFIGKYNNITNIKVTIPRYIGHQQFQHCENIRYLDISNNKSITLNQLEKCIKLYMPQLDKLIINNSQVENDFYKFGPTIKNNENYSKFSLDETYQFMQKIYKIQQGNLFKNLKLKEQYNFICNLDLNFYKESLVGSKLYFNFIKIPNLMKSSKNELIYISLIILILVYNRKIEDIESDKIKLYSGYNIPEYNSLIYKKIPTETILNYIINEKRISNKFTLLFLKSLNPREESIIHNSEFKKCMYILQNIELENLKSDIFLHSSYYTELSDFDFDRDWMFSNEQYHNPINIIHSFNLNNSEYLGNYELGFTRSIFNNITYESKPSINLKDYSSNKITVAFTNKEWDFYRTYIKYKSTVNIKDFINLFIDCYSVLNCKNRIYSIGMTTGDIILNDLVYITENNINKINGFNWHLTNNLNDITPNSTWDLFLNLFIKSNNYISNMSYLLIQLKNRIKYKEILPFNYFKDEPNIKRLLYKLIDILKNLTYNDLIQKRTYFNFNSKIIKKSIIEMLPIEMSHVISEYCEKKEYSEFLQIYNNVTNFSKRTDISPLNISHIVNTILEYNIFNEFSYLKLDSLEYKTNFIQYSTKLTLFLNII